MAADAAGNDLNAVQVPVTGFCAVQMSGTPVFLDSAAGAKTPIVLPAGYEKLGLFKVDGGPQDASDRGDDIEFFQDGYKIGGAETRTVQINLAESNEFIRELIHGKVPDANGMLTVSDTNNQKFGLFTVVRYKSGAEQRRNGVARVQTVEPDQNTRGEVVGLSVTFEWLRDETIGGKYREWIVPAPTSPSPAPTPTPEPTA